MQFVLRRKGSFATMGHKGDRNDSRAIVVVTGASRGIGRETTLSLVNNGVEVLALARDLADLRSLQDECQSAAGTLQTLAIDISESDAVSQIKRQVNGVRVRALIHNAGKLHHRPMGAHERSELRELFDVNVLAPLEISQALADELKGDPPGHIVHIGSMGGFQDSAKFPGLVAYSASKAALACMAQCLAEEFKDVGIRCNCLAIGAVDTDMLRAAFPEFKAPISAKAMGAYVAEFALNGHNYYNGKVLPVAVSTP